MKLAEHKQWRQFIGVPNQVVSDYQLVCEYNCPRCAQLSLLQQIVDDLKERRTELELFRGTWIHKIQQLNELIKEYEAIIEGATQ